MRPTTLHMVIVSLSLILACSATHAEPQADTAEHNPKHERLSPSGRYVVLEINKIGLLVDLSHVSADRMQQAIALSKLPVIFSHSGARAITEHLRNIPDDDLESPRIRDGVVMVNFYSGDVSNICNRWDADSGAEIARFNAPPYRGLYVGQPERAATALAAWSKDRSKPTATAADVADHLDHIVKVAGLNQVGIGSEFDGVGGETSAGPSSVADYPSLFIERVQRGSTHEILAKLSGATSCA